MSINLGLAIDLIIPGYHSRARKDFIEFVKWYNGSGVSLTPSQKEDLKQVRQAWVPKDFLDYKCEFEKMEEKHQNLSLAFARNREWYTYVSSANGLRDKILEMILNSHR